MSWKLDRIAPILCDLPGLPVRRHIDFKIATLVCKCLHGFALSYLGGPACRYRRCLVGTLAVCRHVQVVHTKDLDELRVTVFRGSWPKLWNHLPAELRMIENLATFRWKLKT
jgi:hypothetical protein